MYAIKERLRTAAGAAVESLYGVRETPQIQATHKDHSGDLTLVLFPLAKYKLGAVEALGEAVGKKMLEFTPEVREFNVVKGFLNLTLSDEYWQSVLARSEDDDFFRPPPRREKVMVEYCSPNTNKPIHLGHMRNMAIGEAVCRILEAAGAEVVRACLFNDRGIHICKSMLAYQDAGGDDSPEKSGLKGDHLVGNYYVEFEKKYRAEVKELVESGIPEAVAENDAPSMKRCRQMLLDWEAGEARTRALWKKLNDWVYEGFQQTFERYGIRFDLLLYESELWQRGKTAVLQSLQAGAFYQKDDGSVWIDLANEGLDQKLVLRSDGTTVYITQDIGVADHKDELHRPDRSVYVIANEQDYHMKVLKLTLQRMGRKYADGLVHLSYGMVDLPTGRMKSREGTVVDADDILQEMYDTAKAATDELGKTESLSSEELCVLYETLGQGALKYFLLKPEPAKRIVFNPAESIDFKGHTGTFIQYVHARACSVLRKAQGLSPDDGGAGPFHELEIAMLKQLAAFSETVGEAAEKLNPALVAHRVYDLAREYNRFYYELPILKAETPALVARRVKISRLTARAVRFGLSLLNIQAPEKM